MDDEADDIDTVLSTGGIKATDTSGNVAIVIADKSEIRDAVYVVLVNCSATAGSADVLYAAGSSVDRVGTNEYVREFWSMDDNTAEDISIDERLGGSGFYEVDEIDADGIYTLSRYDEVNADSAITDDDDGVALEDLALTDSDSIYRNALTGTIDEVSFDDISIANATIIDARSSSAINSSVYDREINSISRLTAAVEAVEELNEADEDAGAFVEIDLYVKDGEITFICVQSVNGEGEGETVAEDTDIDEVVLEDNGNVYLYNDDEQVESKVARDWELYRFTTSEGWTRYDYGANYVYGDPNPWTLVDGGEYYVVIDGVDVY